MSVRGRPQRTSRGGRVSLTLEAGEPSAGLPPLVVRDFTKRYGDQPAVEGLSFDAHHGEILGLVGPNGAGKTTTLRSIAGILPIQEGRVIVGGYDIAAEEAAAKNLLAWVPDDPQPFDSLTVMEHLEFTAALYGVGDWQPKATSLLERFDLMDKAGALGGELSRGMRQKLAICAAWLSEPRVVLLDEPLSGLDPRGIRSARDAIRELAGTGVAVILSSHQLELIEALADRLLIMDHGRRIFVGTLAEARATITKDSGTSLEEVFMAVTGGQREETPSASEAGTE